MSEIAVEAEPIDKTSSWGNAALSAYVPLVVTIILTVILTVWTLYIGWFGVLIAIFGLPYTIFVIIYSGRQTLALSVKDPKTVTTEPLVQSFSYGAQRKTLLLNFFLLLNLIALGFGIVLSGTLNMPAPFILLSCAVVAIVGTFSSLIFNHALIYDKVVVASEYYAIKNHVGKWRLILFSKFLAWFIWVAYSVGGVIVLLVVWKASTS